jgi:hypothetical protein
MPLTTYTAGEVLTASSLNANFTFAASNPPGGLELVSTTTIGSAVASVTVTGAFSATYDNYQIVVSGGVSSTDNNPLRLQLGSSTDGMFGGGVTVGFNTGTVTGFGINNTGTAQIGVTRTNVLSLFVVLTAPFLSEGTGFFAGIGAAGGFFSSGIANNATSFTAFTISPSTGTMTGGTIKVYGYKN